MKTKFLRLFKPNPDAAAAPSPTEQIERARDLHRRGERAAARSLYAEILRAYPGSADAHYRHANLLKDEGALEQAVAGYDQAIALRSDHAHAYCNRAVVLGLMNRFPEALASVDRAVQIDPTDGLARCNRAILLIGRGDKEAALADFDAAILHDPASFAAHFGRGALLQERGEWAGALAAFDRAIVVDPNDAATHYNRGTVLNRRKEWAAALVSYERAIELNPTLTLAFANRGEVLQELGRLPDALDSYERAVELGARDAATLTNRAVLLQRMGRLRTALDGYDEAVAANAAYADAWFNRGTVLAQLDEPHAALESYERAIAAKPGYDLAYVNRGVALQNLNRLPEAIASYRHSITVNPELPEAYFNLALASLQAGDFAAGWSAYEWRWRAEGGPIHRETRSFAEPLWLGQDSIAGQTILLYGEQGLGDSLQFCRYVELVAELGARVILEVPTPLVSLCNTLHGVSQVIPYGSRLPAFDFQCPLMSLPLAFATSFETIPCARGYLAIDAAKVDHWQTRLGPKVKRRIGLTWSGNQTAGTNRRRHFPLSDLLPHLPGDFDYFCLQTDVAAADRQCLSDSPSVFQYQDSLHDFSDTAALCACMDLVISVDTSVAHLCGALGIRTWILLAFVADWRWLTDRDDSPWYPTIRLFRQRTQNDWTGVFERVSAALHAYS